MPAEAKPRAGATLDTTQHNSTQAPQATRAMSNAFGDGRDTAQTRLTEEEKAELLRVGRWGDKTTGMEWGDLTRKIKAAHGGKYPFDWPEAVIFGHLFQGEAKHNDPPDLHVFKGNEKEAEEFLKAHMLPDFKYDSLVYVHGLLKRTDLNKRCARVCELEPRPRDGRVAIEMLLGMERIWAKPENLLIVQSLKDLKEAPEFRELPDMEREDAMMYLFASKDAVQVPGKKAVVLNTGRSASPPPRRRSQPSDSGAGSSS